MPKGVPCRAEAQALEPRVPCASLLLRIMML
jgi:hypothetical protein